MTILGSSRALVLAIAMVLSSSSSIALAQPTAVEKENARALFEEGKQKRDRGDKEGALQRFTAADAIMQAPTIKLALARAHASLNHLVEAREAALGVALIPVASRESQPFTDARAAASQLDKDLAARIPTLNIKVVNLPPEDDAAATITINQTKIPKEALSAPRRVNPGKHVLTGTLRGHDVTSEVELGERETKEVTVDFASIAKAEPVAAQKPKPVGDTSGEQRTTSSSRSPMLWIGLGVAVVGVGVGTVTGLMSVGKSGDLDASCRDSKCPPDAHDALDSANTFATISTIGFIGAGIGLAIAGVGLAIGGGGGGSKTTSSAMLTANGIRGSF